MDVQDEGMSFSEKGWKDECLILRLRCQFLTWLTNAPDSWQCLSSSACQESHSDQSSDRRKPLIRDKRPTAGPWTHLSRRPPSIDWHDVEIQYSTKILAVQNLSVCCHPFCHSVSPSSGSDINKWTNRSTMHSLGFLASCYLSLLHSRPSFLWPSQRTVIKGICLHRYKTAALSYWISNDILSIFLSEHRLFLHNMILQSRDGKNISTPSQY